VKESGIAQVLWWKSHVTNNR